MGSELSDPAIYIQDVGFVSSKIERLAEIIHDLNPELELRFIPAGNRSSADSLPYAIVHCVPGRQPYTVFYFGELDDPVAVLGRLFAGDNRDGNVLQKLEAHERAQKAFQLKENLDELEESGDMFHFLATSRSNNYVNWKDRRTGEIVKLDSDRRRVGREK